MLIQPIILAGGSGTRLWPASRQTHPKQLLALTGSLSLLQETALRLDGFDAAPIAAQPVVVTNEEYRFVVADQLRSVGVTAPLIVLEPMGRNTAPALTLAALLLSDDGGGLGAEGRPAAGGGPAAGAEPAAQGQPAGEAEPATTGDPVLLAMASDHLIKDVPAFHAAVAEGAELAEQGLLVTFGIVPERAETGYGYIRPGAPAPGAKTARRLAGFAEKPDAPTAERYLAEGNYLWNSGMFMMRRSVWLAAVERHCPGIVAACRAAAAGAKREGLFVRPDREAFAACPSDSIDYAVMEKLEPRTPEGEGAGRPRAGRARPKGAGTPPGAEQAQAGPAPEQAVVVPLAAGWSDVGSWDTLWAVSAKDESGNVVHGTAVLESTRDSLVHADSRLVAVLGGDDLVVIETVDAVLVAKKEATHDLKTLVSRVKETDEELTRAHRRVSRPWGSFESLTCGSRFQVKHIVVEPGATLSLQRHAQRAEHWVVVRGIAEVTCGEKVFRLNENESTYVPLGAPHRVANPGSEPLEIIEVQSGDYLGEDDIVRLEDRYGRLEGD